MYIDLHFFCSRWFDDEVALIASKLVTVLKNKGFWRKKALLYSYKYKNLIFGASPYP